MVPSHCRAAGERLLSCTPNAVQGSACSPALRRNVNPRTDPPPLAAHSGVAGRKGEGSQRCATARPSPQLPPPGMLPCTPQGSNCSLACGVYEHWNRPPPLRHTMVLQGGCKGEGSRRAATDQPPPPPDRPPHPAAAPLSSPLRRSGN